MKKRRAKHPRQFQRQKHKADIMWVYVSILFTRKRRKYHSVHFKCKTPQFHTQKTDQHGSKPRRDRAIVSRAPCRWKTDSVYTPTDKIYCRQFSIHQYILNNFQQNTTVKYVSIISGIFFQYNQYMYLEYFQCNIWNSFSIINMWNIFSIINI